mgnify:CR=1 FL=1
MESAKSYREKKAKPLVKKIVQVMRSVYSVYLDISNKFTKLQAAYSRERSGNERLTNKLEEVLEENRELRIVEADLMLMEDRDKKKYRNKGVRQTTIKTVYGEVTYQRTVYEVTEEDGTRHFVYLLDETLELNHVGLISTNMAELRVKGITELFYRECASQVSEMMGQTISPMGVWNVIQALGEKA